MGSDAKDLRKISQQKSLQSYVSDGGTNVFLYVNSSATPVTRLGKRDTNTGKDSVIYQNDGSEIAGKRIFNSSQPVESPVVASQGYGNAVIALDSRSHKEIDDPALDEPPDQDYVFKCLFAVIKTTLNQAETQIWLGVDRKSPKLIYSYPYVAPTTPNNSPDTPIEIGLTHTGTARRKWVASLYRKINNNFELIYFTISAVLIIYKITAQNLIFKGWNVWGNELKTLPVLLIYEIITPLPTPPPANSVTYIQKGVELSNIKLDSLIVGSKKVTIDNSKVEFTDNVNLAGLLCDFDRTTVGKLYYNENKSEITNESYEHSNKKSLWCDQNKLIENNITTSHTKNETYKSKLKNNTEITYRWICHFTVEGANIGGQQQLIGRYLGSTWAGEFNQNQAVESRLSEVVKEDSGIINITGNFTQPHHTKNYEYINSDSDVRTDRFLTSFNQVNRITDHQKVDYTTIKTNTIDTATIVLNGEAHTLYKKTKQNNSVVTTQTRLRQRNTLRSPASDVLTLNEVVTTETIVNDKNLYYLIANQLLTPPTSPTVPSSPPSPQLEEIPVESSPTISASIQGSINFISTQIGDVVALPTGIYYSILSMAVEKKVETRIRSINVDILDNNPNINKTDIIHDTYLIAPTDNDEVATRFIGRDCCAFAIAMVAGKPTLKQYYGIITSCSITATNTLPLPGTTASPSAPGTQTTTTHNYYPGYPQTQTITDISMRLTRIETTDYDLRKALTSLPDHFQFYTLGSIYDLPINLEEFDPNSSGPLPTPITQPMATHCTLLKSDSDAGNSSENLEDLGRLLVSQTTVQKTGKLVSFAEAYHLIKSPAGVVQFVRLPPAKKEKLKTEENFIDADSVVIGRKLPVNKDILATPMKLILCNSTEK